MGKNDYEEKASVGEAASKKRYRNITASIAVFLAVVSGLMYYAYSISGDIQKKQAQIDAAGTLSDTFYDTVVVVESLRIDQLERIRAAGSQGGNDAFQAESEQADTTHQAYEGLQTEKQESLQSAYATVQHLLNVLEKGGDYDAEGFERIKALESERTRSSLFKVKHIWQDYRPLLQKTIHYREDAAENPRFADEVARFALANQKPLYDGVDDIIIGLNEEMIAQSGVLKAVQMAGIGLSLLYFLFFTGFFIRRLEKSDREAAVARRENEEILQTINSGLFLLDKDLNIGSQYSKQLEVLWGKRDFGGKNMLDILADMVADAKELEIADSFVRQLYNPRVKEKLIGSLNPFVRCPMSITLPSGVRETRYLDFQFNRVYQNGEIARVLVNVNDETDSVLLAEKIAKERKQNDLQVEMLFFILNADAKLLHDFIETAKTRNRAVNEILKQPATEQADFIGKLDAVFREVHGMKGDASALNLHGFVAIAERLEDNLKELRGRKTLNGEDFLMLTVLLEELFHLTQMIEDLHARINQTAEEGGRNGSSHAGRLNRNDDSVVKQLAKYVGELADRNGKKVDFHCEGMDNAGIGITLKSRLRELAVQLLRNAVVHGIETPEERTKKHKLSSGHLRLILEEQNGSVRLAVQDDGAGIDVERIRRRLVEQGAYSQEAAAGLDRKTLIRQIFAPGFSTVEESSEDAGRGVGMDIVNERIRQMKGKIAITTKTGAYTCITLTVPK